MYKMTTIFKMMIFFKPGHFDWKMLICLAKNQPPTAHCIFTRMKIKRIDNLRGNIFECGPMPNCQTLENFQTGCHCLQVVNKVKTKPRLPWKQIPFRGTRLVSTIWCQCVSPPVDLYWFSEISIRTEKKIQLELKKKFSYKLTEIFFQCSLNFFFSSKYWTGKKFLWALKKKLS